MFLAPLLYALHAVLTGPAMVIMDLLGVRLGFGFSAGLFDYVLNYGKATRPLVLLPVGLALRARLLRRLPLLHRALRPANTGPRRRCARDREAAPVAGTARTRR